MKITVSRIFRALPLLAFASLVSSCIGEEYEGPDPNLPTRTVLVYLAGDNNLAAIGLTPELLRQGWTYTGNRCLIYYDAPDAAPKLLSLRGGCSVTPTPYIETVAEYAEENSASAEVFARVVRDVVEMYPADSYGLIFASHASGWLPAGALANPGLPGLTNPEFAGQTNPGLPERGLRSIGSDRNPGTTSGGSAEMELAAFAAAIPDRQFDFIVFEACLMAGVEVAYELRNKTAYILASSAELLSPGYAVIYPTDSKHLFNTRLNAKESLQKFAQSYYNYINAQFGVYRSATQTVLCTTQMDALAALAGEVFGGATSSIGNLQHFDRPGSYGDTPALPRYFDFAEYMAQSAPAYRVRVETLLGQIVAWKAATPEFMMGQNGFEIHTHSGLTTYIEQAAFPALNAAYQKTAWYKTLKNTKK